MTQKLTDPNREGYDITRKSWQMFWSPEQGRFHNFNNTDGSYGDGGIYTLWPVAVMVQSIIDAARIYPNEIGPMIKPAVRNFDKYYQPKFHAYCASHYFPENSDIYYDDNAQVASCFLTAYEVTRDPEYFQKGQELVHFLMTGVDRTQFGGVKWHMEKTGSNTCTTAECGIAAMRLAQFIPNHGYLVEFAQYCCNWVFEKVQDGDKLICDGLEDDHHGGYNMNKTKWTYNQGTPITLACRLYAVTGDPKYRARAEDLAYAATSHHTAIFDRDTSNMDARQYRDHTYFYHLLSEGLADFLLYFPNSGAASQVRDELLHTLKYVYYEMRDPTDGLYFQSFELFRINKKYYERFKELTGENKKYQPHPRERVHTDQPVDERPMGKCLIGCGSAARIFFQTARVHPHIR